MRTKLAIIGAAVCLARAASAVTMASQPWTTNRIAEAEARVSAQIVAATNAIPTAELPAYWPLYAVTNADGTAVSRQDFDGLNIDGIGAMASDAWQMATDALGGLSGVAQGATNYTDAVAAEFESGTRQVESAQYAGSSSDAMFAYKVSGDNWNDQYNANDLMRASTNAARAVVREQSLGGIWDSKLGVWWTPVMQNGALRYETNAVQNAADALAAVSNVVASGGLASVDAVDAKISTNNAAFVSAVLSVPLTGADAGDLAELEEYGGYGTVGAALLALIAGLAALKRRMATAETAVSENATAVASVRADLPYRLVEPGKWEFSGVPNRWEITDISYELGDWSITYLVDGGEATDGISTQGAEDALSLTFAYSDEIHITATRASLPGHLCDRAGNLVEVTGDTTITLPEANPGYIRDFLVRLEISGSTVPTITFVAPTGETITYETDGDTFTVPDEAGTWLYSFTESCVAHKFAVALKKVNPVAAPQAQGGV